MENKRACSHVLTFAVFCTDTDDVCTLSVLRVSAKDTELFISGAASNCHKEGSNMKRVMVLTALLSQLLT